MKAQRILVVVRSLRIGGMERVAVTLCDALAATGHEVHLLTFKKVQGGLTPDNPAVHIHTVDFDKLARMTVIGLFYDLFARGILNLFIRKSSAYWRGFYTSFFFERFMRRLEKEYGPLDRVIIRGQGTFEYLWRVRDPRLFLFLENIVHIDGTRPNFTRRAFLNQKNLVAVSQGVRESFETAAGYLGISARSLHVVPNPIPIARIQAMAQEQVAGIPDTPYIVNVARLVPQKGQELLIEAYRRADIPHKLVLVGGGTEEQRLRALVKERGLGDRVVFAGMQQNPYPWMRGAELFVLSSRFEGFGVVLVESLACGTPVVATDCPGGIRDVLIEEQADYLCEPTAEALAAMIRRGLAQPLAIKPHWYERFDSSHVARQVTQLPVPAARREDR